MFDQSKFQKLTLSDFVYQSITDYIVQGKIKPGARLREAQTAEMLGVSRTPVREAFRKLESQNLMHKDPSGAYYVVEWDEKFLNEVASLRSSLESLAVQTAIENLTEADFAKMQEIIQQMDFAKQRQDSDRFIDLDMKFHEIIWERCNHELLKRILLDMKAQVIYFMYLTRPGDEEDYASMHQELYDTLKNGTKASAKDMLEEHILRTAERAILRLQTKLSSKKEQE